MKFLSGLFRLVFYGLFLVTPVLAGGVSGEQGLFCSWFGWLVRPIGFCEISEVVTVITDDNEVVELLKKPAPLVVASTENEVATTTNLELPELNSVVPTPVIDASPIVVQSVGVTEAMLDKRIAEVLMYVDSLPRNLTTIVSSDSSNLNEVVNKDYTLKSLDRVYKSIDRSRDSLSVGAEFSEAIITNSTLAGVTNVSGRLGIGMNSLDDVLAVSGAVYLAEVSTPPTGNRLYNFGGDLYWNGALVTASSSGNWSSSGGDVFRLTGNVGIGTASTTDTLTVNGTVSAGTTTAPLQDAGGQVCNVKAYGAVGDNSTDNYSAIMSAINACKDGGVVFFPMGEYRISQTIVLDEPVTLRGSYAPRWSYNSVPRSSIRADFGSFTGVALIHVRDQSISGAPQGNNGGRIENITIDGGSYGTNIHGLYFEGLVRDWRITDVDVSQVTGNGFLSEVGAGSGNPRGFTIRGLSIYSADGHGFRATALNDSYLEDVLTVGNALRGFYLSSLGETKINNSRAVFNALEGLYIDGSTNNGGLQFTDFSTDRNDRHGVRISATGTTTITFNGLLTRRDGANDGGGTETPYAGLAIIGTSTDKVAPVFVNNLSQITGVDDGGGGTVAPDIGVRVTNARYLRVDGQLWGVSDAYVDGGGTDNFIITDNSIIKTGIADASTETLYYDNTNWVATTSGLFYDGKISIGSTTGSRLLNITAPAQSGARFIDTTNNVTFDMRAEDFQAFFGTFSNHQLRFQTNNTSRLTIDTNGYIGIGTTSPDQMLDVVGTIQSSALLGGATTLSTDVNGNIIRTPSDKRLKTNVKDIDGALDMLLNLRGVTYDWKDTERFGAQREIGFLAQEVDEVVPEVIRKGGEYWSLNTPNLLAVVVEAVKDIWQTVTGNQSRINELEARVEELEKSTKDSTTPSTKESTNTETADTASVYVATDMEEVMVTEGPVSTTTATSSVLNETEEVAEGSTQNSTNTESISTAEVVEEAVDNVPQEEIVIEESIQEQEVMLPEDEIDVDTASTT